MFFNRNVVGADVQIVGIDALREIFAFSKTTAGPRVPSAWRRPRIALVIRAPGARLPLQHRNAACG